MSKSVIIKLSAEDKLTPELKKSLEELKKLHANVDKIDSELKNLKADKRGILSGAIKSDIPTIQKLQKELTLLRESKIKDGQITKKKIELEKTLRVEIEKRTKELEKQKNLTAIHSIRLNRDYETTKKTTKGVKEHTNALRKDSAVRRSAGTAIVKHIRQLESMAVGLYAVNKAYKALVGRGVDLHRQIESQTAGIGALISANTRLKDENSGLNKFHESMRKASEVVMKLKKASVETAATFPELTAVFQQAIGSALGSGKAMGNTLDETIDNTIKMAQRMTNVASAIGMPMVQVNEEIRSIMEGTIDMNSRIAKMLNLSNAEIKKAKQEAGGLVAYLDKALTSFDELAQVQTFDKLQAKIKDVYDSIVIDGAQGFFDAYKLQLQNLYVYLNENSKELSEKLASFLRNLSNVFLNILSFFKEIVNFISPFKEQIIITTKLYIAYLAWDKILSPIKKKIGDLGFAVLKFSRKAQTSIQKIELFNKNIKLATRLSLLAKSAVNGLKLAFKTFAPTVIAFGGLEIFYSLLNKSANEAERLKDIFKQTRKEIGELNFAQARNDLSIIQKKLYDLTTSKHWFDRGIDKIDPNSLTGEDAKEYNRLKQKEKWYKEHLEKIKQIKKDTLVASAKIDLNKTDNWIQKNTAKLKEKPSKQTNYKVENFSKSTIKRLQDDLRAENEAKKKHLLEFQNIQIETFEKSGNYASAWEIKSKQLADSLIGIEANKAKKMFAITKAEYFDRIKEEEKRRDFAYGKLKGTFNEGLQFFARYNIEAQNSFTFAINMMQTAQESLSHNFENFFSRSNKNFLNFGKLAKNVLDDIATQMIKTQVAKPLANAGTQLIGGVVDSFLGLVGFHQGGYTPNININNVAGVVHGGEYVIPNWQVKKNYALVQALEAERVGKKGFFYGGSSANDRSEDNAMRDAKAGMYSDRYNNLRYGGGARDAGGFSGLINQAKKKQKTILSKTTNFLLDTIGAIAGSLIGFNVAGVIGGKIGAAVGKKAIENIGNIAKNLEGIGGLTNTNNSIKNIQKNVDILKGLQSKIEKDSKGGDYKANLALFNKASEKQKILNKKLLEAQQQDVLEGTKKLYEKIFLIKPTLKKPQQALDYSKLISEYIKNGEKAYYKVITDASLFETPNFYSSFYEYAKKKGEKVDEILADAIEGIDEYRFSFEKWANEGNLTKISFMEMNKATMAYEKQAKSMGIDFANLTKENFLDKYNEALRSSFSPQMVEKWNILKQTFIEASDAQKEYLKAHMDGLKRTSDALKQVFDTSAKAISNIRGGKNESSQYEKFLKEARAYEKIVLENPYDYNSAERFASAVSSMSSHMDAYLDEANFQNEFDWRFRKEVVANQFEGFKNTGSMYSEITRMIAELKELKDVLKIKEDLERDRTRFSKRTSDTLEIILNKIAS